MNRLICVLVTALLFAFPFPKASAHEVNPAYLEAIETAPDDFRVLWKQPLKDGRRLRLTPTFPETCARHDIGSRVSNGAVIETWRIQCDLDQADIAIDGLERTLTDVFVKVEFLEGRSVSALLRPSANSLSLNAASSSTPLLAYFRVGIDHIIFGYDHLLFVLGLCLLVRLRQLFLTITAFTVAHSITLGLSTMAGMGLPGAPVETVIALSLVLLAHEALTKLRGGVSLTSEYPWAVAFCFGLIHGFGFAGALANIGLPSDQEIWALLLFNLGVEFGQICFVILVFAIGWILIRLAKPLESHAKLAVAYLVGVSGTYWAFERMVGL
ncbi:MAG: HupE/UreJ family protein [Pseudomonadota bacterium]